MKMLLGYFKFEFFNWGKTGKKAVTVSPWWMFYGTWEKLLCSAPSDRNFMQDDGTQTTQLEMPLESL